MRRVAAITLWAVGLLGLAVLWGRQILPSPAAPTERAVARAVAHHLETLLEGQRRVVRDLAEQLGTWESLPEDAVADALRRVARRHPDLGMLLVADSGGRILAGYDPRRPLGWELLPAGSLDPVVGRSALLSGNGMERLHADTEAGVLRGLELAMALRRPDGARPAYVGATLRMEPLYQVLTGFFGGGVELQVDTAEGHRVFPCQGQALRGGGRWASGTFVVRARDPRSQGTSGLVTASLASLVVLAAGALAWMAMGSRRPRAPEELDGSPRKGAPTS